MCPQYLHSFWIKVNVTMWECQWYPVIDQNRPFDGGLSLAQIPPICLDISYTLHTSKVIWLHPRIPNGYRGKGSTTSTSAKESSYYGRDSTSTGTQLMSVKSPEKDVSLIFFFTKRNPPDNIVWSNLLLLASNYSTNQPLVVSENFLFQNELSTQLIDATSSVAIWDTAFQEEELSYISRYQMLWADKKLEKLLTWHKAHYKCGCIGTHRGKAVKQLTRHGLPWETTFWTCFVCA